MQSSRNLRTAGMEEPSTENLKQRARLPGGTEPHRDPGSPHLWSQTDCSYLRYQEMFSVGGYKPPNSKSMLYSAKGCKRCCMHLE